MDIAKIMCGKRILIWGYGVEGKSSEAFLKKFCKPESVEIYEGAREGIAEEKYDVIIKSPGIVMEEDHPKYTSQTELFLEQFRDRVIGVTGTKGKSTTSTLLYTVLKECGGRGALLLGNIGKPCLDCYEDVTEDTLIVYEMSCHQLAHTKVSPHIALFLNLYQEHLDYYGTLDKYFQAKSNITRSQHGGDILLVGEDVPEIGTQAQIVRIHREHEFDLSINGIQNQYNAEFVYYVATKICGLDGEKVKESMARFSGLPHRLEYIGTAGGGRYYDDSISTIPEATICALQSIENVQTVLVGGKDRGIDYAKLTAVIREKPDIRFICMYDSGKRIYDALRDCGNCIWGGDLREAVALAKQYTKDGGACLLSPAAASYGYFKNFEERGDTFRKYVFEDITRSY